MQESRPFLRAAAGFQSQFAMAEKDESRKSDKTTHAIKRCPYCGAYLKSAVNRCDGCHRRVGPADRHGTAKKPVDWRAYLSAVVAIGVLGLFIYWFL